MGHVADAVLVRHAARLELLVREIADRLEHAEPGLGRLGRRARRDSCR
jgi:hypothetical protein